MKPWGPSRWGQLLAVLTLLVSAGALLPLNARGAKNVWSTVDDCGDYSAVGGATVSLIDSQGQKPTVNTTTAVDSGFFSFAPSPGYYKVRVQPADYTHYTAETPFFRYDGTSSLQLATICVDKVPDRDAWLNLTVVDAQPTSVSGESITFQEFPRVPENATLQGHLRFDPVTNIVQLDAKPLKWNSETLFWVDGAHRFGTTLTSAQYQYNPADALAGRIHITDSVVYSALANTTAGGGNQGWLTTTYRNVSTSSYLQHGQISNVAFYNSGNPILPNPWGTLTVDNETGLVNITANWRFQLDKLTADYNWRGPVGGATVTVLDASRGEPIARAQRTTPAGLAPTHVWLGGTFDVKVEANTYQTVLPTYTINVVNRTDTILLYKGWKLRVIAADADGAPVSDGLTGVLINTLAVNPDIRVLPGQATTGQVSFWPGNGTYLLIVDANGMVAHTETVTVSGQHPPIQITLAPSLQEKYATSVAFANNRDWNNLTVWRNTTLLKDSFLPGVPYSNLRDLRWQIDFKWGSTVDGNIADALPSFTQYVRSAGPFFVVTSSFLTVNGKTYISDANPANFTASVTDGPGTNVTISTSSRYTIQDKTSYIRLNQSKYWVNVTTSADQNVTGYQNNTYFVTMPTTYEMTTKTTTGNVVTRGHVSVEVDPSIDTAVPSPRANLVVEKSLTGIARAEVSGPVGKVSIQDANQDHYKAWVSNETNIVLTANATTDRQNSNVNVKDANFTWEFRQENGTGVPPMRWGIWTSYNFTNLGDWFIVHLNVTQANPANVTQRWINVSVDNVTPVAVIKTNRTTVDNPPTLTINESVPITFIGTNSTDVVYRDTPDLAGKITGWAWDFDSDGKIDRLGPSVSWNFSKPGTFYVNLSVVDSVGHKSANRTMVVTSKDIKKPVVALTILDPSNGWRETNALLENKAYWFNLSKTTDDSLKHPWDNVNLTYNFQWGDGHSWGPFTGTNTSLNQTYTYTRFGSNYKLNISATDAAGNVGWLNRTQVIQANTTAHPDLSIIPNTLVVTPASPEEGAQVRFDVNFTNAKGKATATRLNVQFSIVVSGKDTNQTFTGVRWIDPNGNAITTLAAGANATVEFLWTAPAPGNKSFTIKVWDSDEPDAWITSANQQTSSLAVKEAGWKLYAIIGGLLFIVPGLPLIYYVVRKFRSGDWTLRRRGGKDEDEEEEEEEEDEDDEDRGGKKRL